MALPHFAALVQAQLAQGAVQLTPAPEGIDASPYTPNDAVTKYGTAGNYKPTAEYVTGVVNKSMYLVIIGALLWLFLVCWNCCTCCCWKNGKKEGSKMKKLIAVLLLAFSFMACFISFIVLLANVGELQQFIMKIPDAIDFLTYWKNDTVNILDEIIVANDACAVNPGCSRQDATTGAYLAGCSGNSTLAAASPQSAFAGYKTAIEDANGGSAWTKPTAYTTAANAVRTVYGEISSSLGDINTELKAIDLGLEGFRGSMNSAADGLDVLTNIFWLFFFVVFIQGLVAVLNMAAPPKWQPRKACWCLQPCVTLFYLIVFLLVWVMAFALYVIVTVNADFCIEFDTSLLDLVNSDGTDSLAFYVRCDEDSTIVNPMEDSIATLNRSLGKASTKRAEFVKINEDTTCKTSGPVTQKCKDWEVYTAASGDNAESKRFIDDCNLAEEYIANSTAGNFDPGTLLGQLGCTAFNQRFQALANLLCNDQVELLASFYGAFLAIGILMFLIEVVRKEMRGESEKHKEKRTKRISGIILAATENKVHPI